MSTLPELTHAMAQAIAGDDPAAVDRAIAALYAADGGVEGGAIVDQLLAAHDERHPPTPAPEPPPLPRRHGRVIVAKCA